MVPFVGTPQIPRFPQCVEWILQNQQSNGSWGLVETAYYVDKDILSSTMACVLALKTWNVGPEHIVRGKYKDDFDFSCCCLISTFGRFLCNQNDICAGLDFIGRNFPIVMDEHIVAPLGFNINFTGMLSLAMGMGLKFPISKNDVDGVLYLREMELKRFAIVNYHMKIVVSFISNHVSSLERQRRVILNFRLSGV